jgi:ribosomal protein S18 acetylase RimI-like enzyme
MIEIKCASELGDNAKRKISEIFVNGFGEHLKYFTKDNTKLVEALEHMFVTDVFYVAIIDDEFAGIAACINGESSTVYLNKKELRKHLGFYKGTLAYIFLKPEFQKPPIKTGDKIASVEFVATASKFRGKGAATAIINHLFSLQHYNEYILEVADTNTNAVKLYEKLGFKEFTRIKEKHSKRSGVNFRVYMNYIKPNSI